MGFTSETEAYAFERLFTARIRRMGKVMFSLCPHLGGVRSSCRRGGSGPAAGGGCQVQLPGGGQVQLLGGGGSGPAAGGGQVQLPGGVRSSCRGGSASCTLLWAVCLLCSRRRTFLLVLVFAFA